jgi:hypothetical protein
MSRPINSFVYRTYENKKYHYYWVNMVDDKITRLSDDVANMISSNDEIVLTDIQDLPDKKFSIFPIARRRIVKFGQPTNVADLSFDELMDTAFSAATEFTRLRKLGYLD